MARPILEHKPQQKKRSTVVLRIVVNHTRVGSEFLFSCVFRGYPRVRSNWIACGLIATIENCDERIDIPKVHNTVFIAIRFCEKLASVQNCDERIDVPKVHKAILVAIAQQNRIVLNTNVRESYFAEQNHAILQIKTEWWVWIQ